MAVPFNEAKALLKSMFPAMDEATIGEMLRDNGGHMERTCEQLLAFFETDGCSGGGTGDSDGVRDRAHQGAKLELFWLIFRSTFGHFLVLSWRLFFTRWFSRRWNGSRGGQRGRKLAPH